MDKYAIAGLVIMVASEAGTLAHLEPFRSWNTPICWTGFIMFADSVVRRARGNSWLSSSPREFAFLAAVSIPLWLVFEFYNQFLHNWYYVGLPESLPLRYLGYAWAFATISPALFEGAELVAVWRGRVWGSPDSNHERGRTPDVWNGPAAPRRAAALAVPVALGAGMLLSPFLVPPRVAAYLAAPVWLGFIFLLDPINDRLGFESITGDWRRGRRDRLVNLLVSGLVCGILWEFWNFWARSKWHYTVPIMERAKVFEMPLPGYLGFPPFALECFIMYVFVRGLLCRLAGVAEDAGAARPVGL